VHEYEEISVLFLACRSLQHRIPQKPKESDGGIASARALLSALYGDPPKLRKLTVGFDYWLDCSAIQPPRRSKLRSWEVQLTLAGC
jgi:hypothetical protein